jgi:hypothetical protein
MPSTKRDPVKTSAKRDGLTLKKLGKADKAMFVVCGLAAAGGLYSLLRGKRH